MPDSRPPVGAEALALRPHPVEAAPLDLTVAVRVLGPAHDGHWHLHYTLSGAIELLRLPAPTTAGPADELWRHTCMEAFIQDADGPAYREFNFSPSGQWAAYRFRTERAREPDGPPPAQGPDIRVEHGARSLSVRVRLPQVLMPDQPGAMGLTAVIETRDGAVSYWALHHPRPERPDFHHSGGWTHRPPRPPSPSVLPSA